MKIGEPALGIYASNAAPQRRRVEKPNPSSQLTEREEDCTRPRMVIAATAQLGDVSRGETMEPGLSPIFGPTCSFMAQIIGQVLATRRADSGYAARAYEVNRTRAHANDPHVVASV